MDVRWTLIAQRYDEKYLILHKNCLDKFGIKCEIKFLYFRHHSKSHYNQIVWKWSLSSVLQIFHSQKYSSIKSYVLLLLRLDIDWKYIVLVSTLTRIEIMWFQNMCTVFNWSSKMFRYLLQNFGICILKICLCVWIGSNKHIIIHCTNGK